MDVFAYRKAGRVVERPEIEVDLVRRAVMLVGQRAAAVAAEAANHGRRGSVARAFSASPAHRILAEGRERCGDAAAVPSAALAMAKVRRQRLCRNLEADRPTEAMAGSWLRGHAGILPPLC